MDIPAFWVPNHLPSHIDASRAWSLGFSGSGLGLRLEDFLNPKGPSTYQSYTLLNIELHNYYPKPKYLIIGSFGPLGADFRVFGLGFRLLIHNLKT